MRRLLAAADAVRDQLSSDTWLVVGHLDRDLLGSPPAPTRAAPQRGAAAGSCRACSRWRASRARAWCATPAGGSWTPAAASSGPAVLALLRATVRPGPRHRDGQPRAGVGADRGARASSPTAAATGRQRSSRPARPAAGRRGQPAVARLPARSARRRPRAMPRRRPTRRLREDQRRLVRVSTALRPAADTVALAGTTTDGCRHALEALLAGLADRAAADRATPSSASTSCAPACRSASTAAATVDDLPRHPPHGVRVRGGRGRRATAACTSCPATVPAQRADAPTIAVDADRRATTASTPTSSATARLLRHPRDPPHARPSPPPAWSRSTSREREPSLLRRAARGRRCATRSGATAARTRVDARQFALDSPLVAASDALRAYAVPSFPPGRPLLDAVAATSRRASTRDFDYEPGATTVGTTLDEVLDERKGRVPGLRAPRHRLPALARARRPLRQRLPETDPPPGRPRLVGADVSHAWVSVFVPGGGLGRRRPDERPARQRPLRRRRVRAATTATCRRSRA